MQHPSAVPVPPVKQGCCLPPCRARGHCQPSSRRGGATNKRGGGGGGREDAGYLYLAKLDLELHIIIIM